MPGLMLLAFFLFGMAAGRIACTAFVRSLWDKARQRARESARRRRATVVMDSIDKRVQSLCPQVWRQRRLADAHSVTSPRNDWKRAKGRQEG